MTNQPLFSVLIANYNNGKYLMDAIESVRQQTYTNWEIILVDDSSTDNSHELYKELEHDERIHIFLNNQNRGCGYTKHRCAELAKGEMCGYLDPDDELLSNAIMDSVQALLLDEKYVLSFSRFYYCDENMNILSESRLLDLQGQSYFEHHDYQPEVFAAFRSSAYKASSGIDPIIRAAVDQELFFRLEEQGNVVILDKITYKYRKNPTALTSIPHKCSYWNIWVRHNTCLRRGLPIEQYSFYDFHQMIMNKALDIAADRELQIRSSCAYRLGALFLKPFSWLRNLLRYKKK